MINKIAKFVLFFFAYIPLFIILILKNVVDLKNVLIISGIILLLAFISVFILLKTIGSISPSQRKVKIKEQRNSDYLNFFLTYLLPLFITLSSTRDIIIFGILFIVIAYFYLDTSLFAVNPLLRIFFHLSIYKVEFQDREYFLLTKKKYFVGEQNIKIKNLDPDVIIEDKDD